MATSEVDVIDLTKVLPFGILSEIVATIKTKDSEGIYNSNSFLQDIFLDRQTLNKIVSISAGDNHSLLLDKQGDVYSFGNNGSGQLGRQTLKDNSAQIPTKIPELNNIIAMSAGSLHSLLLDKQGNVYSFGDNRFGQLGREYNNRDEIVTIGIGL